ncbi:hypothetical protein [Kineococcus sp. R86509]|uniref:hypothetical protein n=1 Tax=Kineococcus sp. R86509 TaxID=3093851 RepID=UPI0036D2DA79
MRHLSALDAKSASSATELPAALEELLHAVVALVPSCDRLSFVLQRPGGPLVVDVEESVVATTAGRESAASVAIPLENTTGDRLIFRSRVPGAFALFADELREVLGPAATIVFDGDLDPRSGRSGGLQSFSDVQLVDQAVGALLDEGLEPLEAMEELQRRAADEGTPLVEAAHRLFADLPRRSPPPPSRDGS